MKTIEDMRALIDGKSDHEVVSVELLRRVLADGPGPVDAEQLRAELAEVRRIGQDRLRAFDRAERESRDLRAKLAATEAGLDEAVRYATTLEETVAELRTAQPVAELHEMPATALTQEQEIRASALDSAARLLGPLLAAAGSLDMRDGMAAQELLDTAAEGWLAASQAGNAFIATGWQPTGVAPETTTKETTDGP